MSEERFSPGILNVLLGATAVRMWAGVLCQRRERGVFIFWVDQICVDFVGKYEQIVFFCDSQEVLQFRLAPYPANRVVR